MPLEWIHSSEHVDWDELSQLYLDAPLGYKAPTDLKIAFSNSMFKCLVYDDGILIAAGRALADGTDCSDICDVAVHPKYQGMGLGREIVSKLVTYTSTSPIQTAQSTALASGASAVMSGRSCFWARTA